MLNKNFHQLTLSTKSLAFLLILLFQFQNMKAQTNPKKGEETFNGELNCNYKMKYTAAQRRQFYPFKIAATVKLISFRYHRHHYPVNENELQNDSLIELKTLTTSETDSLTDILYNNFYRKMPDNGYLTQCFFPRNAILFFDEAGQLKESVLLCFHCNRYEASSDKIDMGNNCTQKMEKLRQFFIAMDVKFGTDRLINIYPGEATDE